MTTMKKKWDAPNVRCSPAQWPRGGRQLTTNFYLHEWAVSSSFPELCEPVPPEFEIRAERVAEKILQPVRDRLGRSMILLSGFRPLRLNRAVKGSAGSQHVRCEAADWTTYDIRGAWLTVLEMVADNELAGAGQLIYYPAKGFIHAATPSARYTRPTCCIHWPEGGIAGYRVISPTPAAFALAVPARKDPNTLV